ncbi:MAG: hypothetical protein QOF37_2092 [Thermoleophilaceae bacterium]|nr:hypothetical protein [Thermoleophilaceae bacterium]
MDIAIAGGHGKIALRLTRLLAQRGDRVRGLIRKQEHATDVEDAGGAPVLCDIEALDDISGCLEGAHAVVFAAGAGPGSGPERKRTVDYGGAVKLIEAAQKRGISRYVMISSIGANDPSSGPEQMRPYLEAKHDADEALIASGLDYTIVRPGSLTDDPGSGRITVSTDWSVSGKIPRDDVAATLAEVLHEDGTIGRVFLVVSGETPVAEALRRL